MSKMRRRIIFEDKWQQQVYGKLYTFLTGSDVREKDVKVETDAPLGMLWLNSKETYVVLKIFEGVFQIVREEVPDKENENENG